MEESRRESMLNKVRGLLAKAEGTDNEAEKDTFYAAADRLMTKFAIEEFEIRDLKPGQVSVKAVHRDWQVLGKGMKHLADSMATLMSAVADHCRCRVVFYGLRNPDTFGLKVTCVGLEPDVDWCELLFTSLQVHLLSHVHPRKEPGDSDVDYIIKAKHAGMKWDQIAFNLGWITDIDDFTKPIGLRMYGQYRKECERRNITQVKANPQNWQFNFAASYASRIWTRLYEIKKANEETTHGKELVLVSMKQAVDDEWDDLFANTKWSSYVPADRKANPSASLAGKVAADRADLGSKRIGGSGKAIGS